MTFSESSLRLLPTNVLVGIKKSSILDKGEKQRQVTAIDKKISKITGDYSVRTPQGGRVTVSSAGSAKTSQEQKNGMVGGALASDATLDALRSPENNPGGQPVFVPGTTESSPSEADLDILQAELNSFSQEQGLESLNTQNDLTSAQVSLLEEQRSDLITEIKLLQQTIDLIDVIIEERRLGKAPNPVFNTDILSGDVDEVTQRAFDALDAYISNQIVKPFAENEKYLNELQAQAESEGEPDAQFDLAFGPPVSTKGRYVLSEDGLYYDSRTTGSVPSIESLPVSSTMWNLDFAPNKGGKGISFTEEDAIDVVGTIFDTNADLAVNGRVQKFFEYDDLLQQFEEDKQAHLSEVSGYIAQLLSEGYDATDATVRSYYQQIGATANLYDKKIKKRKRQLQIAALFGGSTFFVSDSFHPLGEGLIFKWTQPKGKAFEKELTEKETSEQNSTTLVTLSTGQKFYWDQSTNSLVDGPGDNVVVGIAGSYQQIPRIPVNDFSYLKAEVVPVDVQRKLTLFSEDLDDVVLPYKPSYVVSPAKPEAFKNDLYVDVPSVADFVHRTASGVDVSASEPLVKSLTDNIVTDDLFVCYNFLDPDAVVSPSSNDFFQNNVVEGSTRLDGKLVAYDQSFLFPSGVGIPYFGGTLFDSNGKYNTLFADVKGSYVRLPNVAKDYEETGRAYKGSRTLDNLFYTGSGATIECWVHVPRVHEDMTNAHRYRVLLANENSGPVESTWVNASNKDNSKTKGLVIGWRDAGSPTNTDGNASGLEFVILPTVGQNSKSPNENYNWGHSVCFAEKYPDGVTAPTSDDASALGMFVPSALQNSAGSGIGDVSAGFCHLAITFDPVKDKMTVFLDSEELCTSSMSTVFGVPVDQISTPTPITMDTNLGEEISINPPKQESWLGDDTWTEQPTRKRSNLPVFTPWVLGGGYTDGIGRINGKSFKPMGFLGSNTNSVYQGQNIYNSIVEETLSGRDYVTGQHNPPMSSNKSNRIVPRSGLDGHVGSFKIYGRPLTKEEVEKNYTAQQDFFKNIRI